MLFRTSTVFVLNKLFNVLIIVNRFLNLLQSPVKLGLIGRWLWQLAVDDDEDDDGDDDDDDGDDAIMIYIFLFIK